ncbi:target of rapamycin [Actinidia rufa]|uniref:Serine/threonine-protein kinase TOR n=1 Tax=Actinidia rufa TaxID=165716 RepID=A0A7J0E948_9ERIC|nr:target of rapamycin [Actinidia rufa]
MHLRFLALWVRLILMCIITISNACQGHMVAINSVMRIVRDPSLSSYHQKVVGSLMFIFKINKSMGLGCVPNLPKVLSHLFNTLRACEHACFLGPFWSTYWIWVENFSILGNICRIVSELWSSFSLPPVNRPLRGSPVLHLVEQLCSTLNDEFRTHLPVILPCCIQVLSDAECFNDYTYVLDILHTLEVVGGHWSYISPCASLEASLEQLTEISMVINLSIPSLFCSFHELYSGKWGEYPVLRGCLGGFFFFDGLFSYVQCGSYLHWFHGIFYIGCDFTTLSFFR